MFKEKKIERPVLYGLVLLLTLVLVTIQWRIYRAQTSWTIVEEPRIIGQTLDPLTQYTFETHLGTSMTLDEIVQEGDEGLLIFLHSECPYCQLDAPLWRLLTQRTRVFGVTEETDLEAIEQFLLDYNLDFPVIIDDENMLSEYLNVTGTPVKLAISSDLRVLQIWDGWTTRSSGQSEMGSLLTMYGIEPDELPEVNGTENQS